VVKVIGLAEVLLVTGREGLVLFQQDLQDDHVAVADAVRFLLVAVSKASLGTGHSHSVAILKYIKSNC